MESTVTHILSELSPVPPVLLAKIDEIYTYYNSSGDDYYYPVSNYYSPYSDGVIDVLEDELVDKNQKQKSCVTLLINLLKALKFGDKPMFQIFINVSPIIYENVE